MNTYLPDLGFTEFVLLAILIALMHLFSAIELLLLKLKNPEHDVLHLRKAANWAIVGILATLVAGYTVQGNILLIGSTVLDPMLLIIPLIFMGRWSLWHIRYSSVTKKLETVKDETDQEVKFHILDTLQANSLPLTKESNTSETQEADLTNYALFDSTLKKYYSEGFHDLILKLAKKYRKLTRDDSFSKALEIDRERFDNILSKMSIDKTIRPEHNSGYLIYTITETGTKEWIRLKALKSAQ